MEGGGAIKLGGCERTDSPPTGFSTTDSASPNALRKRREEEEVKRRDGSEVRLRGCGGVRGETLVRRAGWRQRERWRSDRVIRD